MSPLCICCVFTFTVLHFSCLFIGPETQTRAGYPPVAPKPTVARMATGGAGPDDVGQGSPTVMKKMVPVQSSRPQPSAAASLTQQGEKPIESDHL